MARLTRVTDTLIMVKAKLAGAIRRILEDKLTDYVSVLDFGADPTGMTECSAAFQAACDTGKTVLVPKGIYQIGKTIVLKRSVTVVGEGNDGLINRAMSFLNVVGNIPCFTNWQTIDDPNSMIQVHFKKLFIQYNPTTVPEDITNQDKIAFRFYSDAAGKNGLEFSTFEDITVLGAWMGFHDNCGTYMSALKRFEARDCRYGIVKSLGTTITLENCYANGCRTSYQFGAMSTVKMTNCAMDNGDISIARGSLGEGTGLHILNVRCFEVDSFDAEVNSVATDGEGIASLVHIEGSTGIISGLVGLNNTMKTIAPTLQGSVAKYRLSKGSHVKFLGMEDEFEREGGSEYEGTGGYAVTFLADTDSRALVETSRVNAPRNKIGSSATLLALAQGNVSFLNCVKEGLIVGGTTLETGANGLKVDSVYTASSVAVIGDVARPIYTMKEQGIYLVAASVKNAGDNYCASAIVVFDGTNSSLSFSSPVVFTTLGASGANVTLKVASGTATYQWSVTKLG